MADQTWDWPFLRRPVNHPHLPPHPAWSLRVSTHGDGTADAVIDGQVVSTPDAVDAANLIVALGGTPLPWHHTVQAARQVLALRTEHAPQVPVADVTRALRPLMLPAHTAKVQVRTSHTRDATAAWRLVTHSLDVSIPMRVALASRPLPGLTGRLALDHLKNAPEHNILLAVCDRPDAYTDPQFAHRIATHAQPYVRAKAATHLPFGDPLLRALSLDPEPLVTKAINRRIDQREEALLAKTP